MTIEINKTSLAVAIGALFILFGTSLLGYLYGVSTTRSEYEQRILALKNPKGNGIHFYLEERPEELNGASTLDIYHSTLDCKDIKYGTKMDVYGCVYKRNEKERYPYYNCSKCMDDYLINKLREKQNSVYSQLGI